MVPIGDPYRASGKLDLQSVLTVVILGTCTALIGAGLIWLWEISPIPTLVIFTPLLQGLFLGVALSFMVHRMRMRNPRLLGLIGVACGLLSILLVHYGHHLRFVSMVADSIRTEIAARPVENAGEAEEKKTLLARLDQNPSAFVDLILQKRTGHAGLLGTMILRNEEGVTIKRAKVTGWFLWGLWGAEALAVALVAGIGAAARAGEPFCEDCGYWCAKEPDLFTLPVAETDSLCEAIRQDDFPKVQDLRTRTLVNDGSGLVGVTLHACPQCDQAFVDVSQRVAKGNETKVISVLEPMRVSPEMALALRQPPTPAEPAEEAESDHDGLQPDPDGPQSAPFGEEAV